MRVAVAGHGYVSQILAEDSDPAITGASTVVHHVQGDSWGGEFDAFGICVMRCACPLFALPCPYASLPPPSQRGARAGRAPARCPARRRA